MSIKLLVEGDTMDEIMDQVFGTPGVALPKDAPAGYQIVPDSEMDAGVADEVEFRLGQVVEIPKTGETGWINSYTRFLDGADMFTVRINVGKSFKDMAFLGADLIPAPIH